MAFMSALSSASSNVVALIAQAVEELSMQDPNAKGDFLGDVLTTMPDRPALVLVSVLVAMRKGW